MSLYTVAYNYRVPQTRLPKSRPTTPFTSPDGSDLYNNLMRYCASHLRGLRDECGVSILAASQIFSNDGDGELSFADQSFSFHVVQRVLSASQNSTNVSRTRISEHTLPVIPSEEPTCAIMSMESPLRIRRATAPEKSLILDIETGSPSRRKEKSKSQNDLAARYSSSSDVIQPPPPVRSSAVVDRAFGSPSLPSRSAKFHSLPTSVHPVQPEPTGHDSLTASPFVVQPYPARERAPASPLSTAHRPSCLYPTAALHALCSAHSDSPTEAFQRVNASRSHHRGAESSVKSSLLSLLPDAPAAKPPSNPVPEAEI
ncbi:hypothetical protein FA95DRAFT_1613492 [Auriscalpium vulgare]|uniref:Uncharacterized protein n=1 Tax=Auriscalpium vulgare TaxID=40419 RepID=A0ACB8R2J6_9AGAM|nr:hypothetical protein FA95DRAFT_1613492 [Auriscalpium vulgare]